MTYVAGSRRLGGCGALGGDRCRRSTAASATAAAPAKSLLYVSIHVTPSSSRVDVLRDAAASRAACGVFAAPVPASHLLVVRVSHLVTVRGRWPARPVARAPGRRCRRARGSARRPRRDARVMTGGGCPRSVSSCAMRTLSALTMAT